MLTKELNLREQSQSVLKESNLERLKIALSYFSYLKRHGTIEEQTFEVLVKYACSLFLENEVEEKVESVLEKKLMQFFDSRLSDGTKASLQRFSSGSFSPIQQKINEQHISQILEIVDVKSFCRRTIFSKVRSYLHYYFGYSFWKFDSFFG